MGVKFRKLRSRLSVSWSVVKNKVTAGRPSSASTPSQDQPDEGKRQKPYGTLQEPSGEASAAAGLVWNEARRIYSEPAGLLCRVSAASEDSIACCHECELEEYDDVFVEDEESHDLRESLSWEVEEGIPLETIGSNPEVVRFSSGALEDWVIPAREVALGTVIATGKRETIYRSYWHGNVHVRTRKPSGADEFSQFLDEVATLSNIRHENIQLFMGVCLDMDGGSLGIIMSELKGESLFSRLHKYNHNFTTPSKLKLLKQICEGMEYLHAKGIVHGSLSTKCIHLHYRVCISISPQFGKSRSIEPADLTYLPPECMRQLWKRDGKMVLDHRPTFMEDVFAFGTMVYELVTLEKPLKSLPVESLIWHVGRGDSQPLTLLPKGRLRTIISRCWSDPPASRPDFKELLSTLEQNVVSLTLRLKPSLSLPSIPSELYKSL